MGSWGRRRNGRPKDAWRRISLERLRTAGMGYWHEAAVVAHDRNRWRQNGEDMLAALYGENRPAN